MYRRSCYRLLLALLALTLPSAAHAQRFDPAARAAAVAPYLGDHAAAIVHLEAKRIDIAATRKYLIEQLSILTEADKAQLVQAEPSLSTWLEAWRKAGVEDVFVVASLTDTPPRPPFFFVLPLKKEADADRIARLIFPKLEGDGKPGTPAAEYGWAVIRGSLCMGHIDTLARLKTLEPVEHPRLAESFKTAGDTDVQVVVLPSADTRRVISETLPELPGGLREFSGKDLAAIEHVALGFNLPPQPALHVEARMTDEAAATRLRKLIAQAIVVGKKLPEMKEVVPNYDELAPILTPVQQRDRLTLELSEENQGVRKLFALALPPVQAARKAAERSQGTNNLKQLALAMHSYHDTNGAFPAAYTNKEGKPLLSWRVAILPYIEQQALYDQFHQDEPWDSDHNKGLISKMPKLFAAPGIETQEGFTPYLVPSGKTLVFHGDKRTKIPEITDGSSNTIMIVEAQTDQAVPWTKPAELEVNLDKPLTGLAEARDRGFSAALCDGSVRFISSKIDPAILRKLLEKADGMPFENF